MSRLSTAIQATFELGLTQVGLNALYKIGLKTGYFRWEEERKKKKEPILSSFIYHLFSFPSREALLATLGHNGLEQLTAEADEIVSGKFRQFGGDPVEIQLTPPSPLHHWTKYESGDLRPFDALRAGSSTFDIKLIWEPARFGWAFILGRAFHATGDEKYAGAFWRYFDEFTAANPPFLGPNWMSGQEVGLRLMAFVWAGQVFAPAEQSAPELVSRLTESIAAHAERIPPTLLYARSQNNNHLLTEAAALYTASLALPNHPDAARWRKLGEKWLAWCFKHQIDKSGEYVQHSTNYHRLMLQTALWVKSLQSEVKNPNLRPLTFDPSPLALATHWMLSLLDPFSGQVPNLGANDGALIFPLSTGGFSDFRPVAAAAARAFIGTAQPPGPWDEMSLWLNPQASQTPEIKKPQAATVHSDHSWAYLRAITYTSRPSHADQLHFDLWWRGLNIARDAGTYHYNAAPPWENALTHTSIHNTVTVNGNDQFTRASRFLYLDWKGVASSFSKGASEPAGEWQGLLAYHAAYAHPFEVIHNREATAYPGDRWLVVDRLERLHQHGDGELNYRLHWLLPDWAWKLEQAGDKTTCQIQSPHGWVTLNIEVKPSSSHPDPDAALLQPVVTLARAGSVVWGDLPDCPATRGWVSPTYSVKNPALSLAVEVKSAHSVELITEFIFPPADNGQ
jgi:hypothetical protein